MTNTQAVGRAPKVRQTGNGADLRARVLRSRDRFWRPADFSGPKSTVHHALTALTKEGQLRRVRRGLYWRGTRTLLGMSPPPVDLLVAELLGRAGVGPTGPSAANALRLATQVPRRMHVAVPARPPQDVASVKFVSRASCSRRRTAGLNGTEVALLEVLADMSSSELDPRQTWLHLAEVLRSAEVRPHRLVTAAPTEPASVRSRLRQMFNEQGWESLAEKVPATDSRTRSRSLMA